jgi:phosphoglycolate phosphatase
MSNRWTPFIKQLVIVVELAACIWLFFRMDIMLAPLALALLLAFLVTRGVNAVVHRTGWSRTLMVVVAYLLVVVLLATVPAVILPRLVALLTGFSNTLIKVVSELARADPMPIEITPNLILDLGPFYAPIGQFLNSFLTPGPGALPNLQDLLYPFASGAAVVVRGAVTSLLTVFFVLVISFYIAKDWPSISRFVLTSIPEPLRPELQTLWRELGEVWDAFLRGQLTMVLVMGVIVWIAMTILGVRNAPALGLVSGFAEFIPGVGPTVAGIIGFLIALILGPTWLPLPNLWFAVIVGLTYFLLQQIENMYLLPHIVGRRIDLHPVVVIIGALAGAQLAGVLGILLAAPTIASVRLVFAYAFHKLMDEDPFPAPAAEPSQDTFWRTRLSERPVQAVLFDLDGTLIETDDQIVASLARRLAFLERLLPAAKRMRVARRMLMTSEVVVNGVITLMDRLRLDGLLFRLNDTLHRWGGIRTYEKLLPVPGAPAMLRSLSERYRLAIVTCRNRTEATAFLNQYGLADLFQAVVTRDDSSRLKPHPMPVRLAARQLDVPPEACVMVGDTSVDVRSAKAAKAHAVGVLCGFGERKDLEAADLVIESTAELGAWL